MCIKDRDGFVHYSNFQESLVVPSWDTLLRKGQSQNSEVVRTRKHSN